MKTIIQIPFFLFVGLLKRASVGDKPHGQTPRRIQAVDCLAVRTSTAATCEDNCVQQSSFSTILAIISWQYYLAKKLSNKNSQKQTGNKNSQFGQQLLSRLRDCLSCNFFDEFLFALFLCVMHFLLQFVFSLEVSTTKLKTRDQRTI